MCMNGIRLNFHKNISNSTLMKIQKKTAKTVRSERVKAIEIHQNKPLGYVGLYSGKLQVWDTERLSLVSEVVISDVPIRALALIERNEWLLVGTDDSMISIYELSSLRCIKTFLAHSDFIRRIVVHPTENLFITTSDDASAKLWRYTNEIVNVRTFKGHEHFVMDAAFWPKDTNVFITTSLDGTAKMWDIGVGKCIKTYKGHSNGVNTITFLKDLDYFATGSDDFSVKIWDVNSSQCVSNLQGHQNNVINLYCIDKLNLLASCSEDGTVRFYNLRNYSLEDTLVLQSGRVWQIKEKDDSLIIGTDEDLIFMKIIKGSSLVSKAKERVFFTFENSVYGVKTDNLHNVKELLTPQYFPTELKASPNGRLVALVNDDKFEIYTSLGFRKKFSGDGKDFHFINDKAFVVLDSSTINFYDTNQITKSLKVNNMKKFFYINNELIGGVVNNSTYIYSSSGKAVFTFGFIVKHLVAVNEFLILELNDKIIIYKVEYDIINGYIEQDLDIPEEGISDAFVFIKEYKYIISSYCVDDNVFFFVSMRKGYYIILEGSTYLCNFSAISETLISCYNNTFLLLHDKSIVELPFDHQFLAFQKQVIRNEEPVIDDNIRSKAISFYESLGLYDKALKLCRTDSQKFDIYIKLNRYEEAYEICDSQAKFKRLGSVFQKSNNLDMAADCYYKSKEWKKLFFVDVLNSKKYLKDVAENCEKEGDYNYSFMANFKLKNYSKCGELLKNTPFYNVFAQNYLKK